MNEKVFSKKEKIIIAMIAFVLIFSFCWFELRPYLAKKECINEAWKSTMSSHEPLEKLYDHCMLKKAYK